MHSTRIGNYIFHHNGDYSGQAIINRDGDDEYGPAGRVGEVPAAVLIEFAGKAVISEKISELEQKSGLELFGLESLEAYIED